MELKKHQRSGRREGCKAKESFTGIKSSTESRSVLWRHAEASPLATMERPGCSLGLGAPLPLLPGHPGLCQLLTAMEAGAKGGQARQEAMRIQSSQPSDV